VSEDRERATLERLERIEDIPALPAALVRIWDLATNVETSAEDLAKALSADPGLTGSVLRLANSAYLGFPRKVGTVKQAVVVLGFETVRNLATGASVFRALRGGGLDGDALFRHGLATAVAARILMERRTPGDAGTAFCAGVLHDLGKLVVAAFLPAAHAELAGAVAQGQDYDEAELAAVGLSHPRVGEWFARRWSFPPELEAAVRWHHAPAEAPHHARCVAAVHLGDVAAHRCGAGGSGRPAAPEPQTEALGLFGITAEELDGLAAVVGEMIRDPAAAMIVGGRPAEGDHGR
jgi:HD-like signal output (HDOD) protein